MILATLGYAVALVGGYITLRERLSRLEADNVDMKELVKRLTQDIEIRRKEDADRMLRIENRQEEHLKAMSKTNETLARIEGIMQHFLSTVSGDKTK